ncbi:HTH_Tnp_Tc3_2 domain-containing protein [Trichonephila clavipes]|nr:HTH_Tnp_Tc3_2 domain-containing protein [Trichonephila clavipes]
MGKLPDLDAFDRGQIIGTGDMGFSIFEIIRQLGFSRSTGSRVYQEYIDGGQKTSDQANYKGQLALTVRGERRLRGIVRSQRTQTLAQFTTQLNDSNSRTVSKWTMQRSQRYKGMVAQTWSGVFFCDTVWNLCCMYQPLSMQFDVKGHHTSPTNLTELWTALANIWQVVPVECFQKLVESMPRRMAAVIKARGGSLVTR